MATAAPTTAAGPTTAGAATKERAQARDPKDRVSPWLWLAVIAIIAAKVTSKANGIDLG